MWQREFSIAPVTLCCGGTLYLIPDKLKSLPSVLLAVFLSFFAASSLAFLDGDSFRTPAYSRGSGSPSSSSSSSNETVEVAALLTVVLPPRRANIDCCKMDL